MRVAVRSSGSTASGVGRHARIVVPTLIRDARDPKSPRPRRASHSRLGTRTYNPAVLAASGTSGTWLQGGVGGGVPPSSCSTVWNLVRVSQARTPPTRRISRAGPWSRGMVEVRPPSPYLSWTARLRCPLPSAFMT